MLDWYKEGSEKISNKLQVGQLKLFCYPYLGIFNSNDTDLMEKLNFLDKLKGLKDVLNLWQRAFISRQNFDFQVTGSV